MSKPNRRLTRLLEAFEEAGLAVLRASPGQPSEVLLAEPHLDGPLPLTIYLWKLGSEHSRPSTRRAVMSRPSRSLEVEGTRTLLLGYAEDLDVFAAWQVESHRRAASNASIRVGQKTLDDALAQGVGVQARAAAGSRRAAEIVTTFRPEWVRGYLRVAEQLSDLRERLEEVPASGVAEEVGLELLLRESPAGIETVGFGGPIAEGVDVAYESLSYALGPLPPLPPPKREVGTGFAGIENGELLSPREALEPRRRYLFWLQIGEPVDLSIEQSASELPTELLPDEAELTVALFGFEGELELQPEHDLGHLKVDAEGGISVLRPVVEPQANADTSRRRLYFPVRAPEEEGTARLRCNIYCQGVLVQSRLVTAQVGERPTASEEPALRSTLEYTLSQSLHPKQLGSLPGASLSLMMNGDRDRHQLRFFAPGRNGEEAFKQDSTIDSVKVEEVIEYCREVLRQTAWGTSSEWSEGVTPRYMEQPSPGQLEEDLIRLALRGRLAYVTLIDTLAGGKESRRRLAALSRHSGRIEIAAAPEQFIPAAMFYDAPLDVGSATSSLELCAAFAAAREAPSETLASCACLSGDCPSWDDPKVVCPGGFWGYRHSIGWPISTPTHDSTGMIAYDTAARTAMSWAEELSEAAAHHAQVEALLGKLDVAADRDRLLELLKAGGNQVVYLYCHGGLTPGGAPYIRVGAPGPTWLTLNELWELDLDAGSSLVFLNGCRTTAVSPRQQFDLVNAFVEYGGALGVIGTEITVFEPMAAPFALTFLREFVLEERTVGEAIRRARFDLLERGNPLGLVYVPFVLGGAALERVDRSPQA